MICQKCGLTEATVHREFTVFRQKIEEHLCEPCAGVGINIVPRETPARRPPIEIAGADIDLSVAPDPERPAELLLPDVISVRKLSELLRIKPFIAIAILMQHGVFAALDQNVDYAHAASVCQHCGVKPLRPE